MPSSNLAADIHAYDSNNMVQPRTVLLGVKTMSDIIWGIVPPKKHQKGINMIFQAKLPKSKKLQYLRNHTLDQPKNWWWNSHHQLHVVSSPPLPYRKYNMADVRHLENWHNVIAGRRRSDSHEIWYADAKWDTDHDW